MCAPVPDTLPHVCSRGDVHVLLLGLGKNLNERTKETIRIKRSLFCSLIEVKSMFIVEKEVVVHRGRYNNNKCIVVCLAM